MSRCSVRCVVNPRQARMVPGRRLGRYVTVALIGRGGMGEVWSAQDTDLDRSVALKFLTSETLAGLDPQQITREAKAASALNHHGIVTIHELVAVRIDNCFGHGIGGRQTATRGLREAKDHS